MANTTIQIKRSTSNAAPATLSIGELAYSYQSNTLFIGNTTGNGTIAIAGPSFISNAVNVYVGNVSASTNAWANTKLSNTSGVSFAGNLYFPSGNVGIGTTTTNAPLTIGTADPRISFYTADNTYSLRRSATEMILDSSGYTTIKSESLTKLETRNGSLDFFTGSGSGTSKRMTVDSSGKVGIGTTTPAYALDVNGDARITGNLTLGDAASDTVTINAANLNLANNVNFDSGTLYIDSTNNRIGVGTSLPNSKLSIVDTLTSNTVPGTLEILSTWNNASNTFTAIRANVTDTASAAGSLLMDLQVGGSSKFNVSKAGNALIGGNITIASPWNDFTFTVPGGGGSRSFSVVEAGGVTMFQAASTGTIFRSSIGLGASTVVPDIFLFREASGVLALRNGTANQVFNIYNTYTDASNYERGTIRWTGNALTIGAEFAGTGSPRELLVQSGTGQALRFYAGPTQRWLIDQSGHFITGADNTYDIGVSSSNRPRNVYVAGNILSNSGIGIGSVTPLGSLHISQSVTRQILLNRSEIGTTVTDGAYFGVGGTVADGLGIINQEAGPIKFGTSDTERMRIDASGRVGIGTTSPTEKLQIDNGNIHLPASTANTGALIGASSSDNFTTDGVILPHYSLKWALGSSGGSPSAFLSGYGGIRLFTGGIEQVRIIGGNVGIGTTVPSSRLQVNGSITSVNTGPVQYFRSGANNITLSMYNEANGTLSFEGSAGQLFSITNDLTGSIFSVNDVSGIPSIDVNATGDVALAPFTGNVGIGTSNPVYKLDVNGDARITGNLTLGDSTTDTITVNAANFNLANNVSFDSGTLYIDKTNDRIGIGTTSPSYKLDVIGIVNTTDQFRSVGTGGDFRFNAGFGGTIAALGTVGATPFMMFTNNTERVRIDANGKVGIGTSSPSDSLHVVGGIRLTSSLRDNNYASNLLNLGTDVGGQVQLQSTNDILFDIPNDTNKFNFRTGSSISTKVTITSSGRVGVGTTSPSYGLHIQNTSGEIAMFIGQSGTTGLFTQWRYNSTAGSAYGEISTYGNNNALRIQAQSGGGHTIINPLSGNVGIGTTSALSKLHIVHASPSSSNGLRINDSDGDAGVTLGRNGSDGYFDILGLSNIYGLRFRTNGTSADKLLVDSSGNISIMGHYSTSNGSSFNGLTSAYYVSAGNASPGYDAGIQFRNGSNGYKAAIQPSSGSLAFYTNGNNTNFDSSMIRMFIGTTGNVGIGTTTPSSRLHVAKAGTGDEFIIGDLASNYIKMGGIGSGTSYLTSFESLFSISNPFTNGVLSLNTAGSERLRVTKDGNVGIGLTSPTAKLHVQGDVANNIAEFRHTNGTNGMSLKKTVNDYTNLRVEDTGGRSVTITTQPNDLTTADSYLAAIASGLGSGLSLSSSTNADANHLTLRARGDIALYTNFGSSSLNERLRVTANGNVLIGTATATSNYPVTVYDSVNGGIAFRNGTGFTGLSQNSNDFYFDIARGTAAAGNLIFRNTSSLTEVMRVNNIGNVGIGTSTPNFRLDVAGTINGLSSASDANGLKVTATAGHDSWLNLYRQGYVNWYFGTVNNSTRLDIKNDSLTAMSITGGGLVGINTTSPKTLLDVKPSSTSNTFSITLSSSQILNGFGSLRYAASYAHNDLLIGNFQDAGGYSQTAISFGYTGDSARKFHIGSSNSGTFDANASFVPAVTINSGGSVGIGIASPGYKLEVGASGVLSLNDSTNANRATLQMVASGFDVYTGASKYIRFGTNSIEAMRIEASGNVGIGTAAPGYKLDVAGTVNAATMLVNGLNVLTHANNVGAASNTYSNNTFLKLTGGSINGDVIITGNLVFTGNAVTISSNVLSIGDSLIYLAANNYSGTDTIPIGFIANYGNTTGANVHTGLARNPVNKQYYLFNGYDLEPGTNNQINFGSNNMTNAVLVADIITNNLTLGGANAILTISNVAASANAWANTKLANTTGTFAGSLTTTGVITSLGGINSNGVITITPQDGSLEGGELRLTGAANYPTWVMDSLGNSLRFFNGNVGIQTVGFYNTSGGSNAVNMFVDGSVGIGTGSPAVKLHVQAGAAVSTPRGGGFTKTFFTADAASYFELQSNTTYDILFSSSSGSNYGMVRYENPNQNLSFWTASTQRMTIDASGRVGIGTTTPMANLDVGTNATLPNTVTSIFARGYDGNFALHAATGSGTNAPGQSVGRFGIKYLSTGADTASFNFFRGGNDNDGAIGINTNNAERLRITSAGDIGIGTTIPAAKLDVRGVLGLGTSSNANLNILTVTSSIVGSDNHRVILAGAPHGTNDEFILNLSRGGGAYGGFEVIFGAISRFLISGSSLKGDSYVDIPSSTNLLFKVGSTERMRIDANGNIGIGVTSGYGGTSSNRQLTLQGSSAQLTSSTGTAFFHHGLNVSNVAYLEVTGANPIAFLTNGSESMRITSAGEILHGVTTNSEGSRALFSGYKSNSSSIPYNQLAVLDQSSMTTGVGGAINFLGKYTAAGAITSFASVEAYKDNATDGHFGSALLFKTRTNGSVQGERMRITSTGNVGIGNTAPVGKLTIGVPSGTYGYTLPILDSVYDGTSHFRVYMDGQWNTHLSSIQVLSNQSGLAFDTNGSERMRIDANGNVGIGTTTPTNIASGTASLSLNSTVASSSGILVHQYNGTQYARTGILSGWYSFQDLASGGGISIDEQNALPIRFLTTATERMRIDANGNFGLGVTDPKDNTKPVRLALSITSNTVSSGIFIADNFAFESKGAGLGSHYASSIGSSSNQFTGWHNYEATSDRYFNGNVANGRGFNFWSFTRARQINVDQVGCYYSQPTAFSTSASFGNVYGYVNRLYSQNTGASSGSTTSHYAFYSGLQSAVGPTSTTNQYDFYADSFDNSDSNPNSIITNRYGIYLAYNNNYTTNAYGIYQAGANVKNYFAGSVGIGTTTTSNYKVSINSESRNMLITSAGAITALPAFYMIDSVHSVETILTPISSGTYFGSYTNHPLQFVTNNTERMRLTNSGNVGIGTTGPSARLHVAGASSLTAFRVDGQGAANLYIDYNGSGANYHDATIHYFRTGGGASTIMTASASGLAISNSGIQSTTVVTAAATDQIIDSFANTAWRSAQYNITMTSGTDYHTTQISLIHDGTNAYITEYGTISTANNLGIFNASVVSGTVRLNVVPTFATTTINMLRTTNK